MRIFRIDIDNRFETVIEVLDLQIVCAHCGVFNRKRFVPRLCSVFFRRHLQQLYGIEPTERRRRDFFKFAAVLQINLYFAVIEGYHDVSAVRIGSLIVGNFLTHSRHFLIFMIGNDCRFEYVVYHSELNAHEIIIARPLEEEHELAAHRNRADRTCHSAAEQESLLRHRSLPHFGLIARNAGKINPSGIRRNKRVVQFVIADSRPC